MIDPNVSSDVLEDYALTAGERIEVELLVIGQPSQVAPRLVEGEVLYATARVLVLEVRQAAGRAPARTVRVPWPAIALIRAAVPHHPATT